jgi:hypothetical protein
MWTVTHYYRFTNQAKAEAMEAPADAAIDHVGPIEGVTGWHVNARWLGQQPEKWAQYQIPAPNNPVRVFA